MNTLNIICFLSIARTKSFTITAQELNITQQAVSRKIQKMEQELGFPLFHRNYNMATLTYAGERYYQLFNRFERDLSHAQSRFSVSTQPQALSVGWDVWAGCPDWLEGALREFSRSFTGIDVNLVCLPISASDLLEHALVDLYLSSRYTVVHMANPHVTTTLGEEPLYLAAGKHNVDRLLALDAQDARFLHHLTTRVGIETQEEAVHRCNSAYIRAGLGFGPGLVSVLPNLDSVLLEVAMGNGVTIVPASAVPSLPDELAIRPMGLTMTRTISRHPRPRHPYVEMLEEFLYDYAEKRS